MADRSIFELCAYCPSLCMDRCPVATATGSNTWTPQSKMMAAWLAAEGHRPLTVENSLPFFQCTGCMSCTEACLHKIDVEQALFSARVDAVNAGAVSWKSDRFVDVGTDLEDIFVENVPSDYVVPEAMGVLFPGTAVLRNCPEMLADVFKCFDRLSIDTYAAAPSVALDSGYDLYAAGYTERFREHAARVARILRRFNAVMVLAPSDYYMFKVVYPLYDIKVPEKLTLAFEYIGNLALAHDIPQKVSGTIAYHDCCITGRHLEIYDTPRRVIEHISGRVPVELRRHHQDAMCCGASGSWDIVNSQAAADSGAAVARMGVDAGADILVSSSCKCAANMAGMAKGLEVVDLITLVARGFGD